MSGNPRLNTPFPISDRIESLLGDSIWEEIMPITCEHGAVNLGVGYPNRDPPQFVQDALLQTGKEGGHEAWQYARDMGELALVKELQREYKDLFDLTVATNEILITSGVTQGLNITCQALLNSGDEVICILPAFDLYPNDIALSGAVGRYLPLHADPNDSDKWVFKEEELRALVTPRTRLIIINTPQNVPGKVWTCEELQIVADVATEHDLFVISDEVYMSLTFDGRKHVSIATLPGMRDRTLIMSSPGKAFSCTGWRVGWVIGNKDVIAVLMRVLAQQVFVISTPMQRAFARCLTEATENGYFETLRKEYTSQRDLLFNLIKDAGLQPVMPHGGFFVVADISAVDTKHYYDSFSSVSRDWQFCRWMAKIIRVTAIPVSFFCPDDAKGLYDTYVRFAFCKNREDLVEAGRRLQQLKKYIS